MQKLINKSLKEKIETRRKELNKLLDTETVSSDTILKLSEKLDRLIAEYYLNK